MELVGLPQNSMVQRQIESLIFQDLVLEVVMCAVSDKRPRQRMQAVFFVIAENQMQRLVEVVFPFVRRPVPEQQTTAENPDLGH